MGYLDDAKAALVAMAVKDSAKVASSVVQPHRHTSGARLFFLPTCSVRKMSMLSYHVSTTDFLTPD
jgi:hypothetical protein